MKKFNSDDKIIHVYNYSADTGEFIGEGDAFIPAGTGLPAYCTDITPPTRTPGFASVFGGVHWSVMEDHRNINAYNIINQNEISIYELGAVPDGFTLLKPDSKFDEWNGNAWLKNGKKEYEFHVSESERRLKSLLVDASLKTNHLQTKLFMGVITEEEKLTLSKWVDYVDALNALDLTTSPDISWPVLPFS
ncbi:tail fiber assembly protein [Serratia liquefaciens]|uniref:tail fiber assembly protein n=1 Tax=Serratia liquefaciens TaxID=614 RepID=UPI001F25699E|nr:tail fiber assembly protein [Serratia liquefaciens]MCE9939975.1 tail fiber assembly protein [Serratia liquefaciens]